MTTSSLEKLRSVAAWTRSHPDMIWKGIGMGITLGVFFTILSVMYLPDNLLFPNSDFENGNLLNWKGEDKAFLSQPTFGDNSYYRNRGSSHLIGNFYVGTFENRPNAYQPRGGAQGDEPVGRLESKPFAIRGDRISFLLGGGDDSPRESVSLLVQGQTVLTASGRAMYVGGERMDRITWDVSRWRGQTAQIVILDNSSGKWGHVSADDFRYR